MALTPAGLPLGLAKVLQALSNALPWQLCIAMVSLVWFHTQGCSPLHRFMAEPRSSTSFHTHVCLNAADTSSAMGCWAACGGHLCPRSARSPKKPCCCLIRCRPAWTTTGRMICNRWVSSDACGQAALRAHGPVCLMSQSKPTCIEQTRRPA